VLTDAWQAAHAVVRRLETQEAGVADDPTIGKLGPEYEPLLIEFLKDPWCTMGSIRSRPRAIVELDRMVVYQEHIDVSHAGRLEESLGSKPDPADLFRTCLPYHHPNHRSNGLA